MAAPSPGPEAHAATLFEVQAPCPQCGAAVAWELLQPFQTCPYCQSKLWWPPSRDRYSYLVASNHVTTAEAARGVIVYYAAVRAHAARLGRARNAASSLFDADLAPLGGWGDPLPGVPDVATLMERLRPHYRILELHTVYAPYQLVHTTLAYFTVGRIPGVGRKVFRPIFFLLEDILPAYDRPWDFRDRGLHLTRQKLRPLTVDDLNRAAFLRPASEPIDLEPLLRPWRRQRAILQPDLQPIAFTTEAIHTHRWWVHRPYLYVRAETPDGPRWFLLDGQFRTLAGTPREDEIERVRRGPAPMLAAADLAGPAIRVVTFRCPECGWDVPLDPRAHLQMCANCTRLLAPTAAGLRPHPYRVADLTVPPHHTETAPAARVFLPFWRCAGAIEMDGRAYRRLPEWVRAFLDLPAGSTRDLPDAPLSWWLPAFPVWTVRDYDVWSLEMGRWLALLPEPVDTAAVPLYSVGARPESVVRPAIPASWCEELFPHVVAFFLPRDQERRLNPRILRRLETARVHIEQCDLVFIPVSLDPAARLLAPTGAVGWKALHAGQFPPELQRTVRRWKRRSQHRT